MATDRKFVVKNGLQAQNIDFVDSTTATPTATLTASMNAAGVLSFDSGTLEIDGANNTVNIPTLKLASSLEFEGATDDANETTLTVVDPTADRTITFPDATGTAALLETGQTFTGDIVMENLSVGSSTVLATHSIDYTPNSNYKFSSITGYMTGSEYNAGVIGTNAADTALKFSVLTGPLYTGFLFGTTSATAALEYNSSTGISTQQVTTFTGTNQTQFNVQFDDNGSNVGPLLRTYRNSASPVGTDILGGLDFRGNDAGGNETFYGRVFGRIMDPTEGSEDGAVDIHVSKDGTAAWNASALVARFDKNGMELRGDIIFEGSTVDNAETTLTVTDPTADRTITLPDATGTVALTSDIPSLSGYLQNVVDDTSPQLGGNLDAQSFNITTTGKLYYQNAFTNTGAFPSAGTYSGMFVIDNGSGYPYFSHNAGWIRLAQKSEALSNVVDDTSPQLGGDLDVNGKDFTSSNGIFDFTTATASTTPTINLIPPASHFDTQIKLHTNNTGTFQDIMNDSGVLLMRTNDNNPMYFYTNGTSRLEILGSGTINLKNEARFSEDVVITTNQDKVKWTTDANGTHIKGNSSTTHSNSYIQFWLQSASNSSSASLYIESTGIMMPTSKDIRFEGSTSDSNETTLTVVDPTADRTITLPDATGTVLTTGNSNTPTTTTSSSDADFVLIDDGGTMKKITPTDLGIGSGGGGGSASAYAMIQIFG